MKSSKFRSRPIGTHPLGETTIYFPLEPLTSAKAGEKEGVRVFLKAAKPAAILLFAFIFVAVDLELPPVPYSITKSPNRNHN